ncbi:FUSC family protein [Naumannella sp. ID2617S]|nr:FUSC family protein [Naumannella sp. ID2617S]
MSHNPLATFVVPMRHRRTRRAPSVSRIRPLGRKLINLVWPGHPSTLREVPFRLYPTAVHVLRLTTAAVISYLLTLVVTTGPIDLTGALTALLVLQASTFTTLKMGAVRIGAVLTGVGIAMAVTTWAGLNWWSLGLAIAAALVLAKVFRLGDQALETPISAMLILATAGQEIAVETRVVTTLVGAGVGIAFAVLLPSAVPIRVAAHSVRRVATSQAAVLRRAADSLAERPLRREEVAEWLTESLQVGEQISRAAKQVAAVAESRRYNPRAIGTANLEPVLRSGLDLLERSQVALRTLFWVIEREAPVRGSDDRYGEEVRAAFSVVLHDVADCLTAFGGLVHAEAEGEVEEVEESMAETTEVLRETRAVLTELMLVDPRTDSDAWLLRGTVLNSVEAVLELLDPVARAAERAEWQASQAGRIIGGGPLLNRDTLAGLRAGRVAPRVRRVPAPESSPGSPESSPASSRPDGDGPAAT